MDEETKLAYDANHVFREGYDAGYKDRGKELSCMIKEIHDNVYQEGLERGRKEALEELKMLLKSKNSANHSFVAEPCFQSSHLSGQMSALCLVS